MWFCLTLIKKIESDSIFHALANCSLPVYQCPRRWTNSKPIKVQSLAFAVIYKSVYLWKVSAMLDGLFHTITGCHWRWNMQMTRTIDLRKTPSEDLSLLLIISMTKTYLWANVRQHLTNIYLWLKAKQNSPTHLYMTHMKLRLYYHCKLFHLQCRTQQCMA